MRHEGIDDDHAVFTEPLAAAYQILRQLTIEGRPRADKRLKNKDSGGPAGGGGGGPRD